LAQKHQVFSKWATKAGLMDAHGGRATSGAARPENGQTFDCPEIKTDRAGTSQATVHLKKRRLVEIGLKAKK
jgi:hypothetical protein